MPPTRRTLLAAVVSSFALAGCAGNGDGTDTDGAGGDGTSGDGTSGDGADGGDGGDESTPTATATATPSPTTSATVRVRSHADLGDILVDSEGRTLYMFDSDTQGVGASTCSGGCAQAWPPLTVDGEPTAGGAVEAELSTFEREDGSTQVAVDGWPLYYFANDDGRGDVNGQGVNGVWWVLRPDGTPVREGTTPTPTSAPTAQPATVRVRSHADLGDILVDSEGRTLYMFDSDTQGAGASTCSGGCADSWPPLTAEGDVVAGAGVSATLATFEREDGSTQVTAGGWPLYYYAGDDGPGDANGQGVGGVWWVLRPDGTPVREGSAATPTGTSPPTPTETSTPTPTPTDDGGGGYY